MMQEKVVFVTNAVFLDDSSQEGGVRLCTNDFVSLLRTRFDVLFYPLKINRSLWFRIRSRIGIDVFEDYSSADYEDGLISFIEKNNCTKVFINLSSASDIARVIRQRMGDKVKVILCSHGIESGDLVHTTVSFSNRLPFLKRLTSPWKLGKTIQKEAWYRLLHFDLVFTVSEIELAIEKWLGVKKVVFIPRVYEPAILPWKYIPGKIGFLGDMSHFPNYNGIKKFCDAIVKTGMQRDVQLTIVGKHGDNLNNISREYSFVKATGYLSFADLEKEAATWMYFINPVFYYSKGVSTKLAKGINWGLPVLSTEAGNRGYDFGNGSVVNCNSPEEMCKIIQSRLQQPELLQSDKQNIEKILLSNNSFEDLMNRVYPVIRDL